MKNLLLIASFITGTVLMALEMIGSRMLAPAFGNSIYVWGNLIGVILLAMALGYYIGGHLADNKPRRGLPFYMILGAGIYLLGELFFYRPLLVWLMAYGSLWGSIYSTLILFAVPMLLLALTPPLIIKQLSHDREVGGAIGLVNATSTVGNIFGVFFATFLMIPQLGTHLSMIVCIVVLFVISVLGLMRVNWRLGAVAGLLLLFTVVPAEIKAENVILEEDSVYNHIVLKDEPPELNLYLNSLQFAQSSLHKESYLSWRYQKFFLLLPLVTPTDRLLVLGMGAGTTIDQFRFYFPDILIDAVEIDDKVIAIAKQYFGIEESQTVRIFEDDARRFLSTTDQKYDSVEIDLFQGSLTIPFTASTQEFFRLVDRVLTSKGALAMNVVDTSKDKRLLRTIGQTILSVFPSVFVIDMGGNYIIIASKEDLSLDQLQKRLVSDEPAIASLVSHSSMTKVEREDLAMFTDDLAPVEALSSDFRYENADT